MILVSWKIAGGFPILELEFWWHFAGLDLGHSYGPNSLIFCCVGVFGQILHRYKRHTNSRGQWLEGFGFPDIIRECILDTSSVVDLGVL